MALRIFNFPFFKQTKYLSSAQKEFDLLKPLLQDDSTLVKHATRETIGLVTELNKNLMTPQNLELLRSSVEDANPTEILLGEPNTGLIVRAPLEVVSGDPDQEMVLAAGKGSIYVENESE